MAAIELAGTAVEVCDGGQLDPAVAEEGGQIRRRDDADGLAVRRHGGLLEAVVSHALAGGPHGLVRPDGHHRIGREFRDGGRRQVAARTHSSDDVALGDDPLDDPLAEQERATVGVGRGRATSAIDASGAACRRG